MKKFLLFSLVIFLLLANNVFAVGYKGNIILSENPVLQNTSLNIKGARLIEGHVLKFKKNLSVFVGKYEIKNDNIIIGTNKILDKMVLSLRKIQTNKVEKKVAEEVMRSIIKDLKEVNSKIKKYLREKKRDFQNDLRVYKNRYSKITGKLSLQLNRIIIKVAGDIKNKKALSLKESNVLKHLIKLKNESNKLKNFNKINFRNKKEIKSSLLRILKNIKKEIVGIKVLMGE